MTTWLVTRHTDALDWLREAGIAFDVYVLMRKRSPD
jgi:hypothetical protein